VGLTSLMSVCRAAGHEVKLFDTSFFDTKDITENKRYLGMTEAGEEILNFKPVDVTPYNLVKERCDVGGKLKVVLNEFSPDVVACSVLSVEWSLCTRLLLIAKSCKKNVFTVVGGVHTFSDPDGCLAEEAVDAICIGEGEIVLLDFLQRYGNGKDYETTPGFWVKKDGKVFKNRVGQVLTKLDNLPFFGYDFYDDRLNLRIYDGSVYRSGDHTLTRGCYGKCSYCLYDRMHRVNRDNSKLRRYSIDRFIDELTYLKDKYELNFFRFQDATFLAVSEKYLSELSAKYAQKVGLPFVVDAAPETITNNKARAMADMGCVSASIGVEVGNEKRRAELCNKPVTDAMIIRAFALMNSVGIRTVSFLLLGFPLETLEDYWDTVHLVRKARVQAPAIGFVYPFKGTKLREMAVKLNLFDEKYETEGIGYSRGFPAIHNPRISEEHYRGLLRTFYLYVKFPEKYWQEIRRAEKMDHQGNLIYQKFAQIYSEKMLYNKLSPDMN